LSLLGARLPLPCAPKNERKRRLGRFSSHQQNSTAGLNSNLCYQPPKPCHTTTITTTKRNLATKQNLVTKTKPKSRPKTQNKISPPKTKPGRRNQLLQQKPTLATKQNLVTKTKTLSQKPKRRHKNQTTILPQNPNENLAPKPKTRRRNQLLQQKPTLATKTKTRRRNELSSQKPKQNLAPKNPNLAPKTQTSRLGRWRCREKSIERKPLQIGLFVDGNNFFLLLFVVFSSIFTRHQWAESVPMV